METKCKCDPLKVALHWFFKESSSCKPLADDELNRIHLFYKSSVFRYPARDQCLQFRILHETIKLLNAYNDDNSGRDVQGSTETKSELVNRISDNRPVLVESVAVEKLENIIVTLNSSLLKEAMISWILDTCPSRIENNLCHSKFYEVEVGMSIPSSKDPDGCQAQSLMEFRKMLIAQTVSTICKKVGYMIDDENFMCVSSSDLSDKNMLVIGKTIATDLVSENISTKTENPNDNLVEAVLQLNIGSLIARREAQITGGNMSLNELTNERMKEIKEISEARRLESQPITSWVTSVQNLTKATVHFDVLIRPVETDVILLPLKVNRVNHDALFVMYNYARILSILRRFEDQVSKSEYPPLSNLSEIDFSRIGEKTEELQLLQLLMEWPRILESVVNFVRFEVNLFVIPKFLIALAKAFNSFYFEVVVLVPTNAPHNFAAMMARIYFLKAICKVFEDCLEILQINQKHS